MVIQWVVFAASIAAELLAACGGRTSIDNARNNPGGGEAGAGNSGAWNGSPGPATGPEGRSCSGMTGNECHGHNCCTNLVVPAGSFLMGRGTETCSDCVDGCRPTGMTCNSDEQPEHPASVSSFALDKYEVTVGRFRAFVEAYHGTPPPPEAGAHPVIAGSGWDSAWDTFLPGNRAVLIGSMKCSPRFETWTDAAGANETYPINCVSWYEAFAFCIWDGGRLPTEAEWEYVAAGGDENRFYPWGNDTVQPLPANYARNHNRTFLAVGSEPGGNGRWGHSDLAGSMYEWVLDWHASLFYTESETGCFDCANLEASLYRVVRGGVWDGGAGNLRAAERREAGPGGHDYNIGLRCARDAP
jgi:sulfatase modifying factor 1